MGVMQRMSDVVQQKLNALLNRAEDPTEALDLAYERQIAAVQEVRRHVADVLTSQKRLELQSAQLRASEQKLRTQAKDAVLHGRDDLARLAIARAQEVRAQIDDLDLQIAQLKDQEQKLESTAVKLQIKVEAFRTQRETISAQYSAAEASTKIGEAVTGISEEMANVSLAVDRAKDKTRQMQARAAAIDQLVDSGVLDQIGEGQDTIDKQLASMSGNAAVDSELAALKASVNPTKPSVQALEKTTVVRILGDDQYRVAATDESTLERYDDQLTEALHTGNAETYKALNQQAIRWVKSHGTPIPDNEVVPSVRTLPGEETSLAEAEALLEKQ